MTFTHDVVNHIFKLKGEEVRFAVTAVDPWPAEKIKLGKPGQIMATEEGTIVCAKYGTTLIPVIRCPGGVVKLAEVIIDGKKITKAGEIAAALGLTEAYVPHELKVLS